MHTGKESLYPEWQASRACLLEALRVVCIRGALKRVLCITRSFPQPGGSPKHVLQARATSP